MDFAHSFVTVLGGKIRKASVMRSKNMSPKSEEIPEPIFPILPESGSYGLIVTGVGGTGVVTIGAMLGMAAHIQKLGVSIVDQLGFAQKGGAVVTHVRLSKDQDQIHASRVNNGMADAILACDMLVAGSNKVLDSLNPGKTRAVINTAKNYTGDFTLNSDLDYPTDTLISRLKACTRSNDTKMFNASQIAIKLLGDTLGANLLLTGFAWQSGLIPIKEAPILEAIELNGVAVDWNKEAFAWGRRLAHQPELIEQIMNPDNTTKPLLFTPNSTADWVAKYSKELTLYQNQAYAERYQTLVAKVVQTETKAMLENTGLATVVAKATFKLMAYKDEYEVARLYSEPEFLEKLEEQFEGDYRLQFNLSPPIIAPKDKNTGKPDKIQIGAWVLTVFGLLAKFKFLRGTKLDPFGYLSDRKIERDLIEQYFDTIELLIKGINSDNYELAVEIAAIPMSIRGYGHIKHESVLEARQENGILLKKWYDVTQENISV